MASSHSVATVHVNGEELPVFWVEILPQDVGWATRTPWYIVSFGAEGCPREYVVGTVERSGDLAYPNYHLKNAWPAFDVVKPIFPLIPK